jgi:hypothetical protein
VVSEFLERAGLDFLKNLSLALFIPVTLSPRWNVAVIDSGDTISMNFKSVSAES